MGLFQWLFGKRRRGTSLYEVPVKGMSDRLREGRKHGAFKMLKEKHPSIPDEHIHILIGFGYAAKRQGLDDFATFLLATCQQYEKGDFFVEKRGGKYCLCRKG
ncbi:hypothetical protein ACFL3S_03455 [Gemmatimonadota bacterium]